MTNPGSRFEDDQVEELLERTANREPLIRIAEDPRMPSARAVYDWIDADPNFASRFRAARARGVHGLVEECLTIADTPAVTAIDVADKRVRIDTRLRLAGKWLPKDYGDKLDVNYTGEVTHRHDLSRYSADELATLEALVAKSANAEGDTGGESETPPRQLH